MNVPFFISGDWPFFFSEQIKSWSWMPSAYWAWSNFGENATSRLWIDYPFRLIVKLLSVFGLPWVVIEKLLLFSIIGVTFWSVYQFSGRFFKEKWLRFMSGSIYLGNTYFFLVLGGGQLGVAAAYALFPYVLLRFFNLFDKPSFQNALSVGVFFAMLVALDLRIAYICLIALILYGARKILHVFKYLFIAICIAISLHLYWILPAMVWGVSMPESATGTSSLSFFSVADFSHALTLLHPNWPENLFGRVYFQQPEFMLLPILAFASLLFIKKKEVLFFPLLALVGIFLAKGVNPPGGGVYEFLFTYIPGFMMFRDPTKFYTLIALSYAVLIPITINNIIRFIRGPLAVLRGVPLRKFAVGIFLLFELFLFRDIFLGKTTHSFRFQPIPKEYELLKNTLLSDRRFSRVLWLPNVPHFAYSDDLHPFVDATHVPQSYTPEVLAKNSIGYIVVPTDEGRQFDPSIRQTLIYSLEDNGYPRMGQFANLAVFKNLKAADVFENKEGSSVVWKQTSQNSYIIFDPPETLIMHISFDSGWKVKANNRIFSPEESNDGWIQFTLLAGIKEAQVYFAPDALAKTGALISGLLLLVYVILWMH